LEEVVDDIKDTLRARHIGRLQQNNCSIEAGFVWADLLTNLERVADHSSNIAGGIIDYAHGDRSTHESLRIIKSSDSIYAEKYDEYKEKYALPTATGDICK
jgi:phosphate:Na+ symporter